VFLQVYHINILVEKITIVTVSDNHYVILLAALTKSIEANLSENKAIDMWVIDDGISENSKAKLERSINPKITTLHWKSVKEIIPEGTKLPIDYSSWPLNIYLQFFIPFFIPESTPKVLFMDVDMINCTDISVLWHTHLEGNIAAAVQDSRVKTFDNSWGGILNYRELGLNGTTKYLNSGLLLMDLEKWRTNNVTEIALGYINNNKKFAFYPDQYGINIALANRWKPLDAGWNHFVTPDFAPCNVMHFVGRKPIYESYNGNPAYRDAFYKYLNQTDWKGTKPITESMRYLKKISNKLTKFKTIFNKK